MRAGSWHDGANGLIWNRFADVFQSDGSTNIAWQALEEQFAQTDLIAVDVFILSAPSNNSFNLSANSIAFTLSPFPLCARPVNSGR